MEPGRPDRPQRSNLNFCRAFFEVLDRDALPTRLLAAGAQEVAVGALESWYWWQDPDISGASPFLIRVRGSRLVVEGPTATAIGAAWRRLDEHLRPVARARVAAGDDLGRFLPRPRKRTADRPESFDPEHEAQVLAEFHAALYARWADTPQSRLGGLTPRAAAGDPAKQELLAALLDRMRGIEQERRSRGMQSVSVDDLERSLFQAPAIH